MNTAHPADVPRMPRTATRRSIPSRTAHVSKLEAKAHAEQRARQLAERDLRVLRRVRFDMKSQTASVQISLKLIGHQSPG